MLPHKTWLLFVQAFYRLLCSSMENGSATECVMCLCRLLFTGQSSKTLERRKVPSGGVLFPSYSVHCSIADVCRLSSVTCYFCAFFFPLFSEYVTLAAICRPSPSLFLYFVSLSASLEGCTRPLPLLLLPAEDAHSENIMYWLLCQNKKPH